MKLLVVGALLLLFFAEVLPTLKTDSDSDIDGMILGATASLGTAIIVVLISPRERAPPPLYLDIYQRAPKPKPSPEDTYSWFVFFFTYSWLTPLIWKGWKRLVAMDDLPPMPWYDEPLLGLSQIQEAHQKEGTTLWTILRYQRNVLLLMLFWSALHFSLELVAPIAVYQLLAYLSDPDASKIQPILWLLLMFVGPVFRSVANQQYIFLSTRLAVQVQSSLTQSLYHRAMSSMELEEDLLNDMMSQTPEAKPASKSTSSGRLANLMAVDVAALHRARDCVMVFLGLPVGVSMAFILLYQIVGWTAFAGVACLFLPLPVVASLTRAMNKSQRVVKQAQDSRISLISGYLGSIKAIKYYCLGGCHGSTGRRSKERRKERRTEGLAGCVGVLDSAQPAGPAITPDRSSRHLQSLCRATPVTVKRLVSSSQSPVFSQFGDMLAGLAIIRARAGMPEQFADRLAEKLRYMTRAMEANFNCNRWISVRTDFIPTAVSLMAGISAVSKAGTLAAGLVGFSLTNATGLTDTILQVVRSTNNLEVELQSFERE